MNIKEENKGPISLEINGLNDLQKVVDVVQKWLMEVNVVLLRGELGTGKTTLVKMVGQQLFGLNEVTSPTYSIINIYEDLPKSSIEGIKTIAHMDLYRLNSLSEALDIGIEDYWFDTACCCFIEWPELIQEYLESAIIIDISKGEGELRNFVLSLVKPN